MKKDLRYHHCFDTGTLDHVRRMRHHRQQGHPQLHSAHRPEQSAIWNTYGVNGMGDYRIFNREKKLPANFPYNVNTYTGFGGVLLMMGIDAPQAYDLACPVESSQSIILSINAENFEAVCPRCGSRYNPLTGGGGPVSGVAINNKVGMRQYRVNPSNGGFFISN